jgi:hypothetical protein
MGYRFELRKIVFDSVVKKGQNLNISALWANVGVAPIYQNYKIVIRLVNVDCIYTYYSKEDIRSWLPDMDILWEEDFAIQEELPSGEYELEIGIETGIIEVGNIKLAIAEEKDGYYCMGKIIVK